MRQTIFGGLGHKGIGQLEQRQQLGPQGLVGVKVIVVLPSLLAHADEPHILEDLQMVGYGRAGQMALGRDLPRPAAVVVAGEQGQKDLLPGGIPYGSQGLLAELKLFCKNLHLCLASIHDAAPFFVLRSGGSDYYTKYMEKWGIGKENRDK